MGDALNLLGALHLQCNAPALAIKCLERALLLREKALGGEDVSLAATCSTLGSAYHAKGAQAEALRCHERACSILEAAAGPNDPSLASALYSLGGVHRTI